MIERALLATVRDLLGLSLVAYLFYALLSLRAAHLWAKSGSVLDPDFAPSVTILKPVRGVDAGAYANFASYCALDYPSERIEIIFGALDPADPALEFVRQLQTDFPHIAIHIVTPAPDAPTGLNRKVCNLAAMLLHARHDLLVLCDSDIRVKPDYLRRIVAPFQTFANGNGMVTCPYRACEAQSLAADLEALGVGAEFIPGTLVSRMTEGMGFALGSTIALTRDVLNALGGFLAIKDELADDFRLGNGAQQAGFEVVLSDYVVDDIKGAESFRTMWERRLRWARTVRACRPTGYAGAIVTHGFALSLGFLLASGFHAFGFAAVAFVLAVRLLVALRIAARYTRDPNVARCWYLLPLSDLLSFALYVGSYVGNTIIWRGERFRLLPGGRLELSSKPRIVL